MTNLVDVANMAKVAHVAKVAKVEKCHLMPTFDGRAGQSVYRMAAVVPP
jgi:hypothetical protein